uniref:Predicted protein n=1 Tax=Hordeum vulgare subsp. vulgare TaxID=112509 RepID=F2DUK9_HORVV|nr:predicted protein [Hordeum vulgare subsp. vulgare]
MRLLPCPASTTCAHLWHAAILMHGTVWDGRTDGADTDATHEEREHVLSIKELVCVVHVTHHQHGHGMPSTPKPTVTPHVEEAR